MLRIVTLIGVLGVLGGVLAGCNNATDNAQQTATETMAAQANSEVGMPAISNFSERRMLKDLYELRDRQAATYTYTFSEQTGKLAFFCESVGFGLPYGTQFTNPEKWVSGGVTLPQPEPNGLFMPPTAEGTWVMCLNPTTRKVAPVYVEPRVTVSPFLLPQADGNPATLSKG